MAAVIAGIMADLAADGAEGAIDGAPANHRLGEYLLMFGGRQRHRNIESLHFIAAQ
jgi:hypothetical protein